MNPVRVLFTPTDGLPLCATDRFCRLDVTGARLVPGFLTCEDRGRVLATHNEDIGRFVWARQRATLPLQRRAGGTLSLFIHEYEGNEQPLEIAVNGDLHVLAPDPDLQGTYCWRTLAIPDGTLRPGENELLLRSQNVPFNAWTLAVDVGAPGGNSAKSWDQGATWHEERLGLDYSLGGEYVIRWWADASPAEGVITSPILQMVAPAALDAQATGEGAIQLAGRWGDTPAPDEQHWHTWQPFPLPVAGPYFQWQARLRRRSIEPVLRSVELRFTSGRQCDAQAGSMGVGDLQPRAVAAYPLILEHADHPELRQLWEAESLAPLIAPATTDLERARILCAWVTAQWTHTNSDTVYTPWHAATILDWQRAGRGHNSRAVTGFCVHFAITLAQFCTAAGMSARGVVLATSSQSAMDGHFVCEVFCRELDKWVMLDADFDYYCTHQGMPLNALDIHRLWQAGQAQEIAMVRGLSFGRHPLGQAWPLDHLRAGGYRWFGVPLHQAWLSQPHVQPPNHGVLNYSESDILWWTDDPFLQRCFPLTTTRAEDLYLPPTRSWQSTSTESSITGSSPESARHRQERWRQ